MDMMGLANSTISTTVSPNAMVNLYSSTGYDIGGGRRQLSHYADPVSLAASVQALDGADLRQVEGLNIQGTLRAIYLRMSVSGISRPKAKGGDLIKFDGDTWLIAKVLETWPLWTKAVMVLQEP